jgi:hypothetical protein
LGCSACEPVCRLAASLRVFYVIDEYDGLCCHNWLFRVVENVGALGCRLLTEAMILRRKDPSTVLVAQFKMTGLGDLPHSAC